MRAKHVAIKQRVRIIAGVDAGRFGTIEGVQCGVIAVRADGDKFARHYVTNQLKRVQKIA